MLVFVIAVLGTGSVIVVLNYIDLSMRVAFADEQTGLFSDMRDQARNGELREAIQALEYTVNYYPSGTKQRKGSRLDHIVEVARQEAIQDIITVLRAKSGNDFGPDPKLWIHNLKRSNVGVPRPDQNR